MARPVSTLFLRCTAGALILAASAALPAAAQQTDTANPPASGGFSLENIGKPKQDTAAPRVEGPINPDAPIATRPSAPRTSSPTPTPSQTAQPQPSAPAITQPQSTATRPSAQSGTAQRQPTPTAASRALPGAVPSGAQTPTSPPSAAGADTAPAASTAIPKLPDPLANAPIVHSDDGSGSFPWAWLLAALALLGGLAYYLRSRTGRWQPAVGVPLDEVKPDLPGDTARRDARPENATSTPTPTPQAAAPPPVPAAVAAPVAQSGEGIEVTFLPDYAAATFTRVAMRYAVTVRNTGAEQVAGLTLHAAMIPASAGQDAEVAAFIADDSGEVVHRIESLAPGEAIEIEGEMALPLNQARAVRYGQRLLFVPVAAFAFRFTRDQRACLVPLAYMVGVDSGGAQGKMGPLRLDLGPKTYSQVGQRPLALASAA